MLQKMDGHQKKCGPKLMAKKIVFVFTNLLKVEDLVDLELSNLQQLVIIKKMEKLIYSHLMLKKNI